MNKIDISELRTYKHITINIKTVDNLPLLETFISLLVISTIKDPISISISLTIIPIKKYYQIYYTFTYEKIASK